MKIGIFTDTYLPQKNGVVTSIETFRKSLIENGHEVFIFCPNLPYEHSDPDHVFMFRNIPFPFQPEYTLVLPIGKRFNLRDIGKLGLDVIHIQTFFGMGLVGKRLAKKYKIPTVFTYHTYFDLYLHYLPGPPVLYRRINKSFTKKFCDQMPVVLTPTQIIKDALLSYNVKSQIEVLPTGIDMRNLTPSGANFRKKWHLNTSDFVVSSAGRLGKEKSFDLLINAVAKLKSKIPTIHLVILGDGPQKKKLIRLAETLEITEHITFTGYVEREEVLEAFAESDLFGFASKTETQGMVVVEAMAMGTPAVAVDALGVGEILHGNNGGLLCEYDADDMASRILTLYENPQLLQEKKEQAQQRAKIFSIDALTTQLINHYQTAISLHTESQ